MRQKLQCLHLLFGSLPLVLVNFTVTVLSILLVEAYIELSVLKSSIWPLFSLARFAWDGRMMSFQISSILSMWRIVFSCSFLCASKLMSIVVLKLLRHGAYDLGLGYLEYSRKHDVH